MARILLVDDEAYTRELYQELLTAEGHEVVAAVDGEAALAHALQGGFDLILMDIIMPKKDGVGFLKEYKEGLKTKPNGPIVMLTVLEQDSIIKSCLELGAGGYLVKSELTPDKFLEEVNGYLTKAAN